MMNTGGAAAPWLQTASGLAFDLIRPAADEVRLVDIATALSRIPRFNGHTGGRVAWSVAEHCLLVMNLVERTDDDPALLLAALLHDAHEAYLGDITSPLKRALRLGRPSHAPDELAEMADRADEAIREAFGLPRDYDGKWISLIRDADMLALAIERRAFMAEAPRPWFPMPEPEDVPFAWITPAGAEAAAEAFTDTALGLIARRHGVTRACAAGAALP